MEQSTLILLSNAVVGRSLGICFFPLPLLPPSTSSEFVSLNVGFIANTDALV